MGWRAFRNGRLCEADGARLLRPGLLPGHHAGAVTNRELVARPVCPIPMFNEPTVFTTPDGRRAEDWLKRGFERHAEFFDPAYIAKTCAERRQRTK